MRIFWGTKVKVLAPQKAQIEINPMGKINFCDSKREQNLMSSFQILVILIEPSVQIFELVQIIELFGTVRIYLFLNRFYSAF